MVHALDQPAAAFHRRDGFAPSLADPMLLFASFAGLGLAKV
jgi:hypothetical protein